MPRLHSSSKAPFRSRRALLRTASRASAAAAGATLAFGHIDSVAARQSDATASLLGCWVVNAVNPAPTAVPNGTLVSFTPGGGFTRAGVTHPTESPGFGAWTQVGESEFDVTYLVVQFDMQGTFIGHRKAWLHITLDTSGMSWTAQTLGALIDPKGTETATPALPGGLRGERLVAEPVWLADFKSAIAPPHRAPTLAGTVGPTDWCRMSRPAGRGRWYGGLAGARPWGSPDISPNTTPTLAAGDPYAGGTYTVSQRGDGLHLHKTYLALRR
jgi:hypothetical protein